MISYNIVIVLILKVVSLNNAYSYSFEMTIQILKRFIPSQYYKITGKTYMSLVQFPFSMAYQGNSWIIGFNVLQYSGLIYRL